MVQANVQLTTPARTAEASPRERTLARLIDAARTLLPVDAVTFIPLDARRELLEPAAGWYAHERLREALRSVAVAALERGGPLLLPQGDAHSAVACAVPGEAGEPLGALAAASLDPSLPLGAQDLRTICALAELAGPALEAAARLDGEDRRARDELRLKRAAEDVSASLELGEVYDRVVRHAAAVTGGSRALLSRVNPRSGEPRPEAHVDFSEEAGDRALALGSGSFAQVARTRSPVLTSVRARGRADGALRIGSLMHAPIELGPRLYGVLTVTHEEVRPLRSGGSRAARAPRALVRRGDRQRDRLRSRAAHRAGCSRPASCPNRCRPCPASRPGSCTSRRPAQPTGGDVYGAWRIGTSGEMAVLVGDVAGKGVETAALSAMARFFIEARSHDSSSPAEVLEQANRMLAGRLPSDNFVTAFLAILSGDSLRYANAGHLPPLLVSGRRASVAGELTGCRSASSTARATARASCASGAATSCSRTATASSRRGSGGESYGSERLADLVARLARSLAPQELVRAVHDEVAGWADGLADDAVALALRRRRLSAPAGAFA